LQWDYYPGSSITFEFTTYQLVQFHFHTSSEHTIDSVGADMEAHFVHKDPATGNLAVIGVMINEGAENEFLKAFLDNLPANKNDTVKSATTFLASDLFPDNLSYFTYPGSLTTPPCSEIVEWIVLQNPIEASHDQIEKMHALMHDNNRPI
jgi:carbonic anhydrase